MTAAAGLRAFSLNFFFCVLVVSPASNGQDAASAGGVQLFMMKCAGCHTIGMGALAGPDLKPVSTWAPANVRPAIKRMERSVGLLRNEEVNLLAALLAAPDASDQVAVERKRQALEQAAKLGPASESLGKDLFEGRKPFMNGGVGCTACHQAGTSGGSLGTALDGSFAKMGEQALISAIETPGFPLMRAIYTQRPISKQEAAHVTKYLESISGEKSKESGPRVGMAGMAIGAAFMLGMGLSRRREIRGVRAKLVHDSMRKSG